MRPSATSLETVSLAISRRTPSKPERMTAPGVSSMMTSTPGEVLEGADVAALAADDAALHVVGRHLDHRHGRLGRVARGRALDADRDDVADPPVGLLLGLVLDLADELGHVVAGGLLGLAEEQLAGLGRRQRGQALERADLLLPRRLELLLEGADVGVTVVEALLAPGELGGLGLEPLIAGGGPLLGLDRLGPAVAQLVLDLGPEADHPLLGLDLGLLAQGVGLPPRIGQEALGLLGLGLGRPAERGPHHDVRDQAADDEPGDQEQHCLHWVSPRPAACARPVIGSVTAAAPGMPASSCCSVPEPPSGPGGPGRWSCVAALLGRGLSRWSWVVPVRCRRGGG